MEGNTRIFDSQIIKLLNLGFEVVIFAFAKQMKREAIRENINNSMSQGKFRVKRIKGRKYFVKTIIHINYWIFD